MIEVRPAGRDDADALGEIHAAAWQAAYAPFFDPDFAARSILGKRTVWHERLARGVGSVLLAEADAPGRVPPRLLTTATPRTVPRGPTPIHVQVAHRDPGPREPLSPADVTRARTVADRTPSGPVSLG